MTGFDPKRRDMLKLTAAPPAAAQDAKAAAAPLHVVLRVNGAEHRLALDPRTTLLGALGVKGVGEIAMVGIAPAITNAILHATGKRPRARARAWESAAC